MRAKTGTKPPPERPRSKVGQQFYDKSDETYWLARALYIKEIKDGDDWVYAVRQIKCGPSKDDIEKEDVEMLASELDEPDYRFQPAEENILLRCPVYFEFGEMRARTEADTTTEDSDGSIGGDSGARSVS